MDILDALTAAQPQRSTCSVWAVGRYLERGGRLRVVRSRRVWWVPHIVWSPDGRDWYGYVPLNPIYRPWWRTLRHSLWFEGRVRKEKR